MAEYLLLVEDDPVLGPSLQQRLVLEGFTVAHATTLEEARVILGRRVPDFVLSDIRLPDGSGADLLHDLSARHGSVPIMFMTAFGTLDQAVGLVRQGARDYLTKPFDLDALVARLRSLLSEERGSEPNAPFRTFGLSPATRAVKGMLERLADVDLPVLLIGETGTGKEVAARYLHQAGSRRQKPFEAVNCGQISAELADATFFGNERGAFTGATDRRLGVMETVQDGTLLLDEIGETSPDLQVKLLRVLEERQFRRLGATSDTAFRGRIVCATNRDLDEAVADGSFREDLLFRINVVTVRLPPLRDRLDELEPLLRGFLAEAARRMGAGPMELDETALAMARSHDWPGNIRELRNRVERAVALASGTRLAADDLFPDLARGSPGAAQDRTERSKTVPADTFLPLARARDDAERAHILAALDRTGGQIREAATLLGISRTTLWERMRRHGIERT